MAELRDVSGADAWRDADADATRAPRAVAITLAAFAVALVGAAVYLAGVRHEALFVDFAGLSGLMFCF